MKKHDLFKKVSKYLAYAIVVILLIVFFIISDGKNRKTKFLFLTYPKNYSLVNEKLAEIDLYLYAKDKKTMYVDSDCISQANIVDNITKDRYQLEQLDIKESNDEVKYQNQRYFGYLVKAIFPFVPDDLLVIEDAYLEFNYLNGESLSLKVGSFAFGVISHQNDIRITYLKGLTGNMGSFPSLASIIIEVTNDSEYDITLDNLRFISPFIKANYDGVIELEADLARSSLQLGDIISDYNPKKGGLSSHFSIVIEKHSSKHLLIPLTYQKNTFINQVAFQLNYYRGSILQTITSPSFRYFTTKIEVAPPEQVVYVRN